MTYEQLEQIAVGLFGSQWQKQLADRLGVSKHTIQNWKRQGVAAWVPHKLKAVLADRLSEVMAARAKWYEFTGTPIPTMRRVVWGSQNDKN